MAKLHTILLPLVAGLMLSSGNLMSHEISVETDDLSQRQLAGWAISRFTEAGLSLPPVVIVFPGRDLSGCDGAPGRVHLDRDPIEVRMCWDSGFMLLHELAHVWEAHNVDPALHEPFMALRDGVKSWASSAVSWSERGREHAANVIAWGLLEDPYPISRTYPNDPESLESAFRFLTNRAPLHDGGAPVLQPDRSAFAGRESPPLESGR